MASLLGIGVSGLRASQVALQVTGNNITNADVEGYTRQRAEVATAPEQLTGGGYIGNGSITSDISRIAEQYLFTQIQRDTSSYNNVASYGDNVEQLVSLVAGEFSSLGPSLASLFGAIETSVEDPTSMPSRQLVLSEAQGFVERVNTLNDRLVQQSESINEQLSSLISELNSLAQGLADLNESISQEIAVGQGSQPNGLLDARDELLRQLSEIVSVRTTTESNGVMNVFVGTGQPLVVGNLASSLGVQANPELINADDISFIGANGSQVVITTAINGGKMGGLLDFRNQSLEPAFNALGQITLAVSDTLNQTNAQGFDLEGNFGSAIFESINTSSAMLGRSTTVSGAATLAVSVADVSKLSTDNYRVSITGAGSAAALINDTSGETIAGSFVSTDHDNNPATTNLNLFVPTDPAKTEGLQIYVASGALALGDSFYIRPTRSAANSIAMQMTRPQELAYASPLTTDAALSNTGGGQISPGNVIELIDRYGNIALDAVVTSAPVNISTNGELNESLTVVFTSAASYDVYYDYGGPNQDALIVGSTFTRGQSNGIFDTDPANIQAAVVANSPFYIGFQAELTGTPAAGDTFTIALNKDGISDNRNGIALGASRVNGVMDGGSLNYEDAYGRLVESIGADTAQNRVLRDSTQSLLAASTANRSSISGVNLDEEAANLIKFEQAYNANAQIITVARQIFDTLLNAFR